MAVLVDTLATPPVRPRHPEKAHRPETPVLRKPPWIRVKAPGSPGYAETRRIVREHGLHTVCEEAGCPNIGECWDKKDRKSTRLNSSHEWISYAVFCLK